MKKAERQKSEELATTLLPFLMDMSDRNAVSR